LPRHELEASSALESRRTGPGGKIVKHASLLPLGAGAATGFGCWYALPLLLPGVEPAQAAAAAVATGAAVATIIGQAMIAWAFAAIRRREALGAATDADLRHRLAKLEEQARDLAGGTTLATATPHAAPTANRMADAAADAAMDGGESENASGSTGNAAQNVIELANALRARSRAEAGEKLASRKDEPDAIEPWFQPVVTLPGRKTRYLEAAAFTRDARGEALQLPAGHASSARIDLEMLEHCIRLARRLDRENRNCGVIWRIDQVTLADAEAFSGIRAMLEANAACARFFFPALRCDQFRQVRGDSLERLQAIAAAGFRMALTRCGNSQTGAAALSSGLFAIASAEASLLTAPQSGGNAAMQLRKARNGAARGNGELELLACGVTNEQQAIDLIDQDILLAQGDFFSAVRPLRAGEVAQSAGNL
jgi:EAL domain-containing protein (putative c-di-GMP-specific phosphodiesterase class I)